MIWHIFGYLTLGSTALLGGAAADWLWRTGTSPWSWQRRVKAPKVVAEPYYTDDPYVGNV